MSVWFISEVSGSHFGLSTAVQKCLLQKDVKNEKLLCPKILLFLPTDFFHIPNILSLYPNKNFENLTLGLLLKSGIFGISRNFQAEPI